jgi:hypothetical protein
VASLVIVAGVVVSVTEDDQRSAVTSSLGRDQSREKAVGGVGAARGAVPSDVAPAPVPPPVPGELKPGTPRRVERSASLTLAASPDRIEEVADGVVRTTDRHHGFVLSSEVSSGADQAARASFELSIPSARLAQALGDLSRLAHVKSRNESGQDITAPFVSAQDRLSDLHRERRALLRRLAKAGNPTEVAAIRQQLRMVRSQIAVARGELRSLRHRTNYSNVSVSVESDESAGTGGGFTPGDALDDAGRILATSAAVALVSLAVVLPFSALALSGWMAAHRLARRRREQTLASTPAR